VPDGHSHCLGSPFQFGTTCTNLGSEEMSFCGRQILCAGVKSPCLYRPENWLVRQLSDGPKPVYKVGFIREKGKATAREVQQSLEAGS
jgi:hypothetical protein